MDKEIEQVKAIIKSGDKNRARQLLREILKNEPSADAWYLAAYVATNDQQRIKFLENALSEDPFHEHAAVALEKIKRPDLMVQSAPHRNYQLDAPGTTGGSQLLQNIVIMFTQNGWRTTMYSPELVTLEKRGGPSQASAFFITIVLGILGLIISLLAVATAKTHRATVQAQPDGSVRFSDSKQAIVVIQTHQVARYADSVKSGVGYLEAIVLGVVALVINYFVLFYFCGISWF